MSLADGPDSRRARTRARRVAFTVVFGGAAVLGGLVIAFVRPIEERYWLWRFGRDPQAIAEAGAGSPGSAAQRALERLAKTEGGPRAIAGAYVLELVEGFGGSRELREFLAGGPLTARYGVLGFGLTVLDHETPGAAERRVYAALRSGVETRSGDQVIPVGDSLLAGPALSRLGELIVAATRADRIEVTLARYPLVRFELECGALRAIRSARSAANAIAVLGYTRVRPPETTGSRGSPPPPARSPPE